MKKKKYFLLSRRKGHRQQRIVKLEPKKLCAHSCKKTNKYPVFSHGVYNMPCSHAIVKCMRQ